MSRVLIGGGILAALVGLGFVCPAVAELRLQGAIPGVGAMLLVFGALLTTFGICSVTYGIKLRR
ncbi:MAG TPA: hypothetical protein VGB77_13185 [Abditibacteriaceae bacterium]